MPRYRTISHTADVGAYIYGATPEEVFINAGMVLFEFLTDKPPRRVFNQARSSDCFRKDTGETNISSVSLGSNGNSQNGGVRLTLDGTDWADLLVVWLGELLYYYQVHQKVLTRATVKQLTATSLIADVRFSPFDLSRHGVNYDIKAVTYHQVEFKPVKNGWRARVFFDL